MDKENTHIDFTGADILNYFAGRLTAAEMHAMEKAALDDPFLAEAMEGYGGLPAEEINKRLLLLPGRIAGQETAKVIAVSRPGYAGKWKAAAAILIITGGLAVTYFFTSPNQNVQPTIAKAEDVNKPTNDIPALPQDSISAIGAGRGQVEKAITKEPAIHETETVQADSQFIYRPAKPVLEKEEKLSGGGYIAQAETTSAGVSTSNNVEGYVQNKAAQNAQPVNQAVNEVAKAETTSVPAAPLVRFNAQVMAADNTPLPFANVRVTGQNVGTYADAKGNFKLIAGDSTLQVEIKSVGYIARTLTLDVDAMPAKIFLVPDDIALKNKTVISGKASSVNRTRRAVLQADTVMDARPADGWQNYDAYVSNNLEISTSVKQQKIHGEVEISFDVLNNGAVTNLKVDKSLCSDCDEAVLRLIKEGPKWKSDSGKSAKGKLKVKF